MSATMHALRSLRYKRADDAFQFRHKSRTTLSRSRIDARQLVWPFDSRLSSRRIWLHPRSLGELFCLGPDCCVVDFRAPVEVQRVYFLRARHRPPFSSRNRIVYRPLVRNDAETPSRNTGITNVGVPNNAPVHRCSRYRGIRNSVNRSVHRVESMMYRYLVIRAASDVYVFTSTENREFRGWLGPAEIFKPYCVLSRSFLGLLVSDKRLR